MTVFFILCGALGVAAGIIAARWVLEVLRDFDDDTIWDEEDD